jgi:hypothetical protein
LGKEPVAILHRPLPAAMVNSRSHALIDNLEKSLGRRPVTITVDGETKEVFVYKGDVANAAIKLAGSYFRCSGIVLW